jgi:hypothetical protein
LVVSLLAINKVTTFEKSFNNSTISVQTGNGKQTVVGDKAIVVQEGSVVNYTDNRIGEFDEVPKLMKKDYPIFVNNFVRYSLGICVS